MDEAQTLTGALAALPESSWLLADMLAKFALYASSLMAAGVALWALPALGGLNSPDLPLRTGIAAALTSAVLTLFRIPLQTGRLMDDGLSGMFDGEVMAIVVEGPLGLSSSIRLAGLALCVLALARHPWRWLAVPGALAVCLSFSLIGHATREPAWLLPVLLCIHLVVISYWWAALPVLNRMAADHENSAALAVCAERFGRRALVFVPLLILVGALFALTLLDDVGALVTTAYGTGLLLKVAIVSLVLAIAAINKLSITPALASGSASAPAILRRSLRLEAIAFFGVFIATAFLTSALPLPA